MRPKVIIHKPLPTLEQTAQLYGMPMKQAREIEALVLERFGDGPLRGNRTTKANPRRGGGKGRGVPQPVSGQRG